MGKKVIMNVSKEFTLDAAHRLTFHEGKCRNLHGHAWRVVITIGVNAQDFFDFGIIKSVIHDELDHALLYWEGDKVLSKFVEDNASEKFRVVKFPFETTAENIAQWIKLKIMEQWDLVEERVKVQVEETVNSCVVT